MSSKRDYYEVLDVSHEVDDAELKKAYRKLAFEFHPDRNPDDPSASEKFKEAAEAYQVLSDREKRAMYDRYGHAAERQPGFGAGFTDVDDVFSTFGDIFGDFFGFGERRHGHPSRGGDVETSVEIAFEEAVRGVKKQVRFARRALCDACGGSGAARGTRRESCGACRGRGQVTHTRGFFMISTTCPTCRGQGQIVREPCPACRGKGAVDREETIEVAIPAGVDDGQTLRVSGRGQVSPRGGAAGHLFVVLRVRPDPRFVRRGVDLHVDASIAFTTAALGGEITVPTLEGDATIEIEPGTQSGQTIVLRGAGVPRLDGYGQGDEIVALRVLVPKKLSAREKELLRELAAESGEPPAVAAKRQERGGFFGKRRKS